MSSPRWAPARRPVLCVGEILVDLIGEPAAAVDGIDSFVPRVGGAPANVAVGLQRLGTPAAFLGAVANDEFGPWLLERLSREGVDVARAVRRLEGQTRLALVTGAPGQRDFTFYGYPAADSLLAPDDIPAEAITGAAAIYFGSLPLAAELSRSAIEEAVRHAVASDVPICFDPNPRARVWAADLELARSLILGIARFACVLKLSTRDLDVLELSAQDLPAVAPRAEVVVLTDGARGCRYWCRAGEGRIPAFPVDAVDETGAGDAFTAALIARGVANGFRYQPDDLTFAAAAGALATTRMGAMDALPSGDEVAAFVAGRSGVVWNAG